MHRNTLLLVVILAVIAALVVGVNLGKNMTGQTQKILPTPTAIVTPTPLNVAQTYTDLACGFSLVYPGVFTKMESASGSAILQNAADPTQALAIACQKDIPRSPLPDDKIETVYILNPSGATVSARLYHDASQKDGTLIDTLIFRHPKTGLDIFIAASPSAAFRQILSTITLLP